MLHNPVLTIHDAHVIPTPKPDINTFLLSSFPWSSETIVRGIETEEVLPNLPTVEGTFGELCDHTLSELPDEVWQNFEKSFLI